MILLLFTILLVSGLGSLSSSVPRQFHLVKELKSWTEAQQYCREKFTDIATIHDMTENEKVKSLINEAGVEKAWIGLRNVSSPKWLWSLADRDLYRENEAEFRVWAPGQPDDDAKGCVLATNEGGNWYDETCSRASSFICYEGGSSTHPYVLVTELKIWADAQRYCREKHTDLASVRNQAENDQIEAVRGGTYAWIGLFRDVWEWSDVSSSSFRHWSTGEPTYDKDPNSQGVVCTQLLASGQWNDAGCHYRFPFICYEERKVKRQIVRVNFLEASPENINDHAVQQAILQQIETEGEWDAGRCQTDLDYTTRWKDLQRGEEERRGEEEDEENWVTHTHTATLHLSDSPSGMNPLLITTLLLSGLCSLSSSVPRQFHVVKEQKNWTEAQQYCREEFTDLATIDDMTEMEKVNSLIREADAGNAWIGLKLGSKQTDDWEWSDGSSYSFNYWNSGEPNFGSETEFCAEARSSGRWNDAGCHYPRSFICYDEKPLVLVRQNKTWTEALQYCREHHVDLVSVTSEQVQRWVSERAKGASTAHVWVGLRHACGLGWFWVCGETICYSNWIPGQEQAEPCKHRVGAVESGGQWVSNLTETDKLNFICTTEDPQVELLPGSAA
ncbi:macrophage mannose receptor 1-like [Sardina pilchardus]|uniref:macrophage mannose receptor 1-like n=1 Tax=Sardina pilchardus TaxID=27697 RepID=UPI002E1526D3